MTYKVFLLVFFFFQAEDGIRDVAVTGVQTCALPISRTSWTLPKGVSTLSSATEPTTRRSPTPAPRRGEVPVEQEREPLPRLRRERRGARDHGVREEVPARARPGRRERRERAAEDVLRRPDLPQDALRHRFDRDRLVRLVPDVVVGRERQRRVAELGLARELRLRHVRHADDVHPPVP